MSLKYCSAPHTLCSVYTRDSQRCEEQRDEWAYTCEGERFVDCHQKTGSSWLVLSWPWKPLGSGLHSGQDRL